jgi:hypothetical protein
MACQFLALLKGRRVASVVRRYYYQAFVAEPLEVGPKGTAVVSRSLLVNKVGEERGHGKGDQATRCHRV